MKTFTVIGSLTLMLAAHAQADAVVTKQRSWTETYPVAANAQLTINNVWGSVHVRQGPPGEIRIVVDEKRTAPDQDRFDRSLESLRLAVEVASDSVSMKVGDPSSRWQQLDDCRGCRVDFQFEVLVPQGTVLDLSTVTDGSVSVDGVAGTVSASNVNGPVAVAGLRDCATIKSVNGPVDLRFASPPSVDCDVETINGHITLGLPDATGLDVALDQMNGQTKSDLEMVAITLPAKVQQTSQDGRFRYRVEQFSGIRLGSGGPTFTLKSMNGNIRIKKN